jgi:hypothetical protein
MINEYKRHEFEKYTSLMVTLANGKGCTGFKNVVGADVMVGSGSAGVISSTSSITVASVSCNCIADDGVSVLTTAILSSDAGALIT